MSLPRDHWQRVIARLDPETDFRDIARILATREFPWDTLQALSFALFRTYAVPSIGRLLDSTGEFTRRVQKRYDDTGLLLEAVLEHGLDTPAGRASVRRINQMHAAYDIPNDDFRYVLATFVVIPVRWIDQHGYRGLTDREVRGLTNYYRDLGKHMAIQDVPDTFAGFEQLLDGYERDHFGYDVGSRRVADATLDLMTTFPLNRLAPARLMKRFSYALMEDHLLDAFGYARPTPLERALATKALRARAAVIARRPARPDPRWVRDMGYYRTYPAGHTIGELGTFPDQRSSMRQSFQIATDAAQATTNRPTIP